MEEFVAILLGLGVVLAIVTIVGHGIWVMLSRLFGARRPPDRLPPGRSPNPFENRSTDGATALDVLRRQLDSYAFRDALDEEMRERLSAAIREEEHKLAERRAHVTPVAAVDEVVLTPVAVAPAAVTESAVTTPDTGPGTARHGEFQATRLASEVAAGESLPLGERARKFAASREAAAMELAAEPSEPAKPTVPVSRLFAAFMEENNIRWGELVGGMLIVGCSVALVISLWAQIAGRPLLQFVLFNGVTAALFGVGMYTERRWKIHTTSRGLLVIATLLVPLNFLALAAFTQASPPTDLLPIVGEVGSLVVFALLVLMAGRSLVPGDAALLIVGVMTPCLMQLIIRRFAGPEMSSGTLYGLAGPVVAVYLCSACIAIRRRWVSGATGSASAESAPSEATVSEPKSTTSLLAEIDAHRVLLLLGVLSAAAIMPLALLLYLVPPVRETLHWLSPLLSMCGLPALLTGLLFWRRMTGGEIRVSATADLRSERRGHVDASLRVANSGLQTAGIAVGVLGAMLMCAGVVLAWPDPATLLPTALATAVAMLGVAIWFGIPAAHVPAAMASAAAAIVGFYVLRGDVRWTVDAAAPLKDALLSATTGYVLLPLAAMFAGIAGWLRGMRRDEASFIYGLVTAATAAASLALAVWFGFGRAGDPENVIWLLAIYALGALGAGVALGRVDAARGGAAILLAAVVQCVVFRYGSIWGLQQPWVTALLVHATLVALGCGALVTVVAGRLRVPSAMWAARFADVLRALLWSAFVTSAAAAIWLAATMYSAPAGAIAIHLAWLSVVWIALAVLNASPAIFTASQVALVLAIGFGVTAAVESREWYLARRYPWLDPWFLELVGIALAAYCVFVGIVRWLIGHAEARHEVHVLDSAVLTWTAAATRLLAPPWLSVNRIVEVGIVALAAVLATYAVTPGVAQELSPMEVAGVRVPTSLDHFEVPGISHSHAAGRLAWMFLGVVAGMLSFGLLRQVVRWRVVGLAIVTMAMFAMLAVRWEADIAVASALRWTTACFFVIASILMWVLRGKVFIRSEDPFIRVSERRGHVVRDLCVAFVMLVYLAMGAFVVQAALMRPDVSVGVQAAWPWVLAWGLLGGVVALILPRLAVAEDRARMARLYSPAVPAGIGGRSWQMHARDVLLLLAAMPAVILVTFAVAHVLDRHPIIGPEPGSWFHRIGLDVSYGVPLGLIALAFIGHAIRDRSSRFAFAAGLLFNAVATMAVLWRLARGGGTLDAIAWIRVAQVNAIVAGVVALVWEGAVVWHRRRRLNAKPQAAEWPLLLVTQVGLAAALCGAFLLPGVVNLLFDAPPAAWAVAADGVLGWSSVALAIVAAVWIWWRRGVSQNGVGLFAAGMVAIVALTAARMDNGNWQAYHTLLAGNCIAMWALPVVARMAYWLIVGAHADAPRLNWSTPAVRVFGIVSVFLAFWGYGSDPGATWWTVAALLAVCACCVWVAWRERRRGFMWIAAVLLNIAVTIWWFESGYRLTGTPPGNGADLEWLWFNVLALAVMGLVSVWVECRRILAASQEPPRRLGLALHRFAAWLIVVALLLGTTAGLLSDLFGAPLVVNFPLIWAAWLASAALALTCLWDPAVRWSVACLYCLGLTAVGIYLDGLDFRTPMFQWALANALAAYSLGTSALWVGRGWLGVVVGRWGMEVESLAKPQAVGTAGRFEGSGQGWLVTANVLVGGFVLGLVVFVELSVADFTQRMVGAYAVGAQAFAIVLLARGGVRTPLQYLALLWGVFFAALFGWAFLPPDFVEPWLHRLVVTVAALAVMVVVYGFGLVKLLKRENEWTRAAARLVPTAVLAVGLVLVVLAAEVTAFVQNGTVQITATARIVIGCALAGLVVASLAAALLPGRDPLGLSERGRTAYVYAAEALAALLFLHIRVTMPWLFHGWFLRFWPLVVMGIAFLGVGLGEVFQRQRQRVLSEPLQTTGALLPLLPALGFWVLSSQVHYSLLLLSIGVLYASLSVLRQSFLYGMLAAIAANGSLWYLLHDRQGLSFVDHPQLWLIPPALSALIAGYINRERLTPQQSAALRYASAIVIYVSSTADIFINGVAEAPWLPAVLAGLSILGALSGIVLRVRAFLYLGVAFLMVALLTVIWHAGERHTWVWSASGIVAGALIIALFGLFEKRRDDVLRVVEELKHWHA